MRLVEKIAPVLKPTKPNIIRRDPDTKYQRGFIEISLDFTFAIMVFSKSISVFFVVFDIIFS